MHFTKTAKSCQNLQILPKLKLSISLIPNDNMRLPKSNLLLIEAVPWASACNSHPDLFLSVVLSFSVLNIFFFIICNLKYHHIIRLSTTMSFICIAAIVNQGCDVALHDYAMMFI